ncbi:MAG: AAA family ATPase [Oscillospiraceae bacterium]|nr:AAA family ATPase [Oscillospiraceae bacterium]
MPYSLDAEQSVLGTIIINSTALDKVATILNPEHFHIGLHQDLFRSMCNAESVDVVRLIEQTVQDGVFTNQDEARGYLMKLADGVVSPSSVVEYARIIVDKHNQRILIENAAAIVEKGKSGVLSQEDYTALLQALQTASENKESNDFALVDGNTLRNTDYGKLRWNVEGLLHEGLVIYASMPKVGKSIHILNICVAIASGADYWGMKTYQSDVVYLGLEDSYRRLKDRINAMADDTVDLSRLHSGITARTIDEGFLQQIDGYMKKYPNIGVIVVDVLQAVRGNTRKGRNAYEFDRHELQALKAVADKYRIALITIHHDSKMKPSKGVVDSFSGSRGITGSGDLLLSAFIEPDNAKQAKLFIKSREMESRCFLMQHSDRGTLEWDYVDEPDYTENTETKTKANEPNPAESLLNELFEKRDSVTLVEIKEKRDERGIHKVQLNRARQKLGIKTNANNAGKTQNGEPVIWYIQ